MDKIWHRGIIKYLLKKRLSPKDIYAEIATLGDDAPVLSTMKKWEAECKRGRLALKMTSEHFSKSQKTHQH